METVSERSPKIGEQKQKIEDDFISQLPTLILCLCIVEATINSGTTLLGIQQCNREPKFRQRFFPIKRDHIFHRSLSPSQVSLR